MKKHHLILGSTVLFGCLFYQEGLRINLSLFALANIIFTYYQSASKTLIIKTLSALSLFTAFAFAWYGDTASFFALCFSVVFLLFQNQKKKINLIQTIPIAIITIFASIVRPFILKKLVANDKIEQ